MTCDADLLRILQSLQRRHGWAYVSERVLRELFEQDTGHAPGVGTIRAALDRMSAQGILHQVWLLRGGLLPDGRVATAGTRLVRVALSRAERHSFMARAAGYERAFREGRARRRRETTTGKVNQAALFQLMSAARDVRRPPAPETGASEFERMREGALAKLAALAPSLEPPS
jgi:DNA-binding PadR family transcriptional regulator